MLHLQLEPAGIRIDALRQFEIDERPVLGAGNDDPGLVQLLVDRVDVQDDALEVRVRAEGLASLVGELRQPGERKAA